MISKLREKNDLLLKKYQNKGDEKNAVKHRIMKEMLNYDDCFQRVSFDEAHTILTSLGVSNWKDVYAKLLSIK